MIGGGCAMFSPTATRSSMTMSCGLLHLAGVRSSTTRRRANYYVGPARSADSQCVRHRGCNEDLPPSAGKGVGKLGDILRLTG